MSSAKNDVFSGIPDAKNLSKMKNDFDECECVEIFELFSEKIVEHVKCSMNQPFYFIHESYNVLNRLLRHLIDRLGYVCVLTSAISAGAWTINAFHAIVVNLIT